MCKQESIPVWCVTTALRNKNEQWPSNHETDCEQNDWHTPVKKPSLAVGNKLK